jgi:hypothetical protein
MKSLFFLFCAVLLSLHTIAAQSPVGRWKVVSHNSVFEGETFDSHAALLQQRPCAAKIFYEINADASFRLNAAASGCDDRYIKIQEKLYSKTQWKVEGNKIMTSSSNFAVGQTYTFTIKGNTMTWTGTEGQGVIVYERLP